MGCKESTDARDQALRWIEEGERQLPMIYDRTWERAEATGRENERLRGLAEENEQLRHRLETSACECERLRAEVSQLRIENDRYRREREEIVEALSRVIDGTLLRLVSLGS